MAILTNTRLSTFRMCPRRHQLKYELLLRPARVSSALRMGRAFHDALETYDITGSIPTVMRMLDEQPLPEHMTDSEYLCELETVKRLFMAHRWRWGDDELEVVATEQEFCIALRNPDTGHPTPNFWLAGKIDRIVQLPDGALAIQEYKTTGRPLGLDSELWQRLRVDQQIGIYFLAAREMGHPVTEILYDVTRKPTIKPGNVPLLDDDGLKIVVDDDSGERLMLKSGKRPRQSAGVGMTLLTRPETPEEYGDRLTEDIGQRPDYYFARRRYTRTEQDLLDLQHELWHQQKQLREMQRHDRWYRNPSGLTCPFCDFRNICLDGVEVNRDNPPPDGFVFAETAHEELSILE